MLHTVETKPVAIASARTPEACDFTDRLGMLRYDVRMIELAVEALRQHYNGSEDEISAIIFACRRLHGDIELLSEEVLPPITETERERIRGLTA